MCTLHRAKFTITLFLHIFSMVTPLAKRNIFETLFIANLPMGHVIGMSTEYIKTIPQQFDSKKCLVSGLLFFLQNFEDYCLTLYGNLFALYVHCIYT